VDSQFWQSSNATAMSSSASLTSMDMRKIINVTATYSDAIERVAKEIFPLSVPLNCCIPL